MHRDDSPSPRVSYINTRSKFFKKKPSETNQSTSSNSPEHNTGDFWKNKGNQAYAKGFYTTAIDNYTKAIEMNDGQSIYFSNRANCYRNLGQLDKALKDAQSACQLDEANIKAHYICGCILAEISKKDDSKIAKAENRFKKALRLCDSLKKTQFIQSISIKLYRLRKLRFLKEQNFKAEHKKNVLQLMRKSYVEGIITKQHHDKLSQAEKKIDNSIKRQIPDYMHCKITLEIMENPYTTEAGLTYEKSVLEEYFSKNGRTEPITRQPLKGPIYPNQALKQSIQDFMQKNPWAYEYTEGQSYNDIIF